ncbi:MAG: trypsin-like peptidase domain-containing protein [Phycisphaerae bacterium]|nr:trypsin-like peptidase domain-containing protein [Phycisphaerae bacterium]
MQDRRRTPVVEAVLKTRDAVVNISATSVVVSRSRFGFDSLFDDIFQAPRRATSAGSGFLIHPSGYIVTNAHVVARSTDSKITFADEHEGKAHPARVVTMDREHDLAVLKIDTDRPLPYLPLGRSDDLMIGETVLAIGNPLGYHHTVTTGVIGALHRTLEFGSSVKYSDLIQTDAAINPGNSGGPLLNINGELIGINTAIRGDAQNIGFAIPVDHLRRLLPEMMTMEIETDRRMQSGMLVGDGEVVRVLSVTEGGPADRAGLQAGDVLRQVQGKPVTQAMDFYAVVLERKPGDTIPLVVERSGQTRSAALVLALMPKPDGAKLAWERLGLRLAEMTSQQVREFGLPRRLGLIITEVDAAGPARRAGIRRGDVLAQLGRYGLNDFDTLGQLLKDIRPGNTVYAGWLRSSGEYIFRYGEHVRVR